MSKNINTSSRQIYFRLLTYLKPYWRRVALAMAAMLTIAGLEPLLPALMQPLVDESLIGKNAESMLWVPLALLGVFVAKGLAEYLAGVLSQGVAQAVIADLRQAMFAKLMSIPIARQQALGSANLLSRVTFDVTQVSTALSTVWLVLIRDTLILIGLLGFLLYTSWQLTLFIVMIAPVVAWIIRKASGLMRTSSAEVQRSMGRVTHLLDEALTGRREISIYAGQAREQARFAQTVTQLYQQSMSIVKVSSANVPLVQVLAAIAVACVLYVATQLSAQSLLTPGQLIAFITAMSMLFEPIRRLTGINEPLQKGLSAAISVFHLLDEPDEPDQSDVVQSEHVAVTGALSLVNLSYAYTEQSVLAVDDLNVSIKAGETLALVGSSGSGKSTLVNLLCRFVEPTSGQILCDGQDIQQMGLSDWRQSLALVSQHIVLFDDSIASNIAYGCLSSDQIDWDRLELAAKAAHAWAFIQQLPQGFHTPVGEGGARLSGGQRQRLALARAFYKDAPILILDEATSALDTESESLISQALQALKGKKTVIVIAHRLATVQSADHILVLAHGRIAEQGTHHTLMAQAGVYAGLVQGSNHPH